MPSPTVAESKVRCSHKDAPATLATSRGMAPKGRIFDAGAGYIFQRSLVVSPYVKLDDRYDDNRKVKRAWRASRAAIGMHAMAITYAARHYTDGLIDLEWIEEKLPNAKERKAALDALVEAGLFEPTAGGDGFVVHDYLEHQASRAQIEAKKAVRVAAGAKGGEAKWRNRSKDPSSNGVAHD